MGLLMMFLVVRLAFIQGSMVRRVVTMLFISSIDAPSLGVLLWNLGFLFMSQISCTILVILEIKFCICDTS